MSRYQDGIIYKIESKKGNKVYYGSTTQGLKERLRHHKSIKGQADRGEKKYISSFEVLKYDDYVISLVERYPCNSKQELGKRERYYIENNECVNKFIPTRTKKEHYEDNKEEILQKKKEKMTCECGAIITRHHIRKHERTIKHQNWKKLYDFIVLL